jgi:broad specificity phosphatase PhoE
VIRVLALVLLSLACRAHANELLWTRIKAEPNIVILTRHMESGGGKPLVWDESGGCRGEARLTSAGRSDARQLGGLFSAQAIKPFVISSPMCRCLETATIAFERLTGRPEAFC